MQVLVAALEALVSRRFPCGFSFPRFSQRYKRHQEDLEREGRSEGLNHGDFEKRAAAKKPKQPPAQAAHTELVAPKAVKPVKQGSCLLFCVGPCFGGAAVH